MNPYSMKPRWAASITSQRPAAAMARVPPNSKMVTRFGACMRWAREAASIGMPVPMKAVVLSVIIRAAVQTSSSVGEYPSDTGLFIVHSLRHGFEAFETFPPDKFQVFPVIFNPVDVLVEIGLGGGRLLGGFNPLLYVFLVTHMDVAHLAWMGSERCVHYSVHQIVGDDGAVRVAADNLSVYDFLSADDHPLTGARHLSRKATDPVYLGIAEFVCPVHMDQAHIQDQGWHQTDWVPCEWAFDHLGGAVFQGIGAQHRAYRDEGYAHGGGLEARGEGGVAPFNTGLHPPTLHFPAEDIGDAVHLQANIGNIHPFDQAGGQQYIRLIHPLPDDAQVFFSLAHDLIDQRHRAAH